MRYLAIVPARKNSKRIRHKNVQRIDRKLLVQYSIEAALGAKKPDMVCVSSDDGRVLALAEGMGVPLVLRRPRALALDTTPMAAVVRHVLQEVERSVGLMPEHIVLLQPTSPFRTARDVDAALKVYERSGKQSLISVVDVTQHPFDCFCVGKRGKLEFLQSFGQSVGLRQRYSRYYYIDGSIYVCRTRRFLRTGMLFDEDSAVQVFPKSHGIDIDTWFDLLVARAMWSYANREFPKLFEY